MGEIIITQNCLRAFMAYLQQEEKSRATQEKYLRDVRAFSEYIGQASVTKEQTIRYKQHLLHQGYAVRSINSMLASLNSFLDFMGLAECKTKNIRQQKRTYSSAERELTKEEYFRLLKASENQPRLRLMMETICATGIRVSELQFFTVCAVRQGEITIRCKNKTRTILVPGKLRRLLLDHAAKCRIRKGPVFRSRNGKPLDRSYIWAQMKKLCEKAGVRRSKVFPHNLRKLFARTFYSLEKDIAKLADILGHSSIDTTRIYIMTTGEEHRRKLERLGLIP